MSRSVRAYIVFIANSLIFFLIAEFTIHCALPIQYGDESYYYKIILLYYDIESKEKKCILQIYKFNPLLMFYS